MAIGKGDLYATYIIQDVTKFLKALTITIDGTPSYKGRRFSNISNKDEIMMNFKWSDREPVDEGVNDGEEGRDHE